MNLTACELFEQIVATYPENVAVVYQDQRLTYAELNTKANLLAHYLLESGIQIESPVAIFLKPGLNMIISLLAILKAGGVYVPVDYSYPNERIKYLLQDSKPAMVITDSIQCAKLDYLNHTQILDINQLNFNGYSDSNPILPNLKSTNLLYIIYTSGSTGVPKGVLVEHHSVINMALTCIDQLGVNPNCRILQLSSFSFDVSVAEWAMALLSGASLYLINKDFFSPQEIIKQIKQHQITTIILAHAILETFPKVQLPTLKVIASGGEPLHQHTVDFWADGRTFINIYGITETTVCSTFAICKSGQQQLTIGRPFANTEVHILNESLQAVAVNEPGEIYIGGKGIARGYLNKSQLTAKRFISDPFHQNKRLYRTGDIGQWLPNGEIAYIGRFDEQIKINGMRIELVEIEQTLEKHPLIARAAVIVQSAISPPQLFAYILLQSDATVCKDEIRQFLIKHLPSYIVAIKLIYVTDFPLTPHGKIDKQQLLNLNENFTGATSKQENIPDKIVGIIQAMLQCDMIAHEKNFLDLGIDSLNMVNLATKLSAEFQHDFDVVTLFTYTNVTELAEHISSVLEN